MRNFTSTVQCYRDREKENFRANPLSTEHKSRGALPQQENIIWSELGGEGGEESGGDREDADHVHSLESLVDHYLEPASFPLTPMSFFDSPLLPVYYPSNHNSAALNHYPPDGVDQKGLIRDLQAAFQSVGESYGELRVEIYRAIRKGSTPLHAAADAAYPPQVIHEVVLEHLRKLGINAGICKSQRDSEKNSQRDSFPAEEYEYMDVIQSDKGAQTHASERVIIDLRFRSQFEIARPSAAYMDLLKVVPAAYVGPPHVLQKTLKLLSEAIKRSLESQGMSLPPWRRLPFLHSKWLSPLYSRSILALPSTNLNHIINKPSAKRETFPCSTHKALSHKRESSNCIISNNPTCGVPSPLIDSKHNSSRRENSHFLNKPPLLSARPLPMDSKRSRKSGNLTSHTPTNKQSNNQIGEPIRVPWKLHLLSSPPRSLR